MNSEMEGNPTCVICGKEFASEVCCCVFPPVPICEGCKYQHFNKPGSHQFLPYSLSYHIASLADRNQVVKRKRDLDAAELALKGNFDQMDNLEKQLNAVYEAAMRRLIDLKENCQGKIDALRRDLSDVTERAKYEANAHMMDRNYEASEQMAKAILQFSEYDDPSTLSMIEGRVNYQPEVLNSVFSLDCSFTVPETFPKSASSGPLVKDISVSQAVPDSYARSEPISTKPEAISTVPKQISILSGPTPPLLPLLASRYMAVFDGLTGTWKPKINFSRPTSIDDKSAAVLLADNSVIVAGGGAGKNRSSAEVFRILEGGEVTQLINLNDARQFPGICQNAGEILLFGGVNAIELSQSEKLEIAELQAWTRLPNMLTPRSNFNPCIHSNLVYLCGGAKTTACEGFNLATNTFQSLNLVLPECGPTATVIVGTEKVILAWHYVMWWDGLQSTRVTRHADWQVWSNSPPQVVNNSAFIVRSWNDCAFRIDLDGLHYTKLPLANP